MSGAKKKTKGGILAKIKSVSYTLIPLNELRDLPTRRGLGIIATFYLLLVMYFIYLVVNGFYLHKNDKFLSLEEEQYKGFGTCENVPRMIDGRYTVDYNGNWDKSLDFKHSLGVYDLIFTKFEGVYMCNLYLILKFIELFKAEVMYIRQFIVLTIMCINLWQALWSNINLSYQLHWRSTII